MGEGREEASVCGDTRRSRDDSVSDVYRGNESSYRNSGRRLQLGRAREGSSACMAREEQQERVTRAAGERAASMANG